MSLEPITYPGHEKDEVDRMRSALREQDALDKANQESSSIYDTVVVTVACDLGTTSFTFNANGRPHRDVFESFTGYRLSNYTVAFTSWSANYCVTANKFEIVRFHSHLEETCGRVSLVWEKQGKFTKVHSSDQVLELLGGESL